MCKKYRMQFACLVFLSAAQRDMLSSEELSHTVQQPHEDETLSIRQTLVLVRGCNADVPKELLHILNVASVSASVR